MKISKSKLIKIITEEVENHLSEDKISSRAAWFQEECERLRKFYESVEQGYFEDLGLIGLEEFQAHLRQVVDACQKYVAQLDKQFGQEWGLNDVAPDDIDENELLTQANALLGKGTK